MSLVPISRCPVCGGGARSPSSEGIASARRDIGRHYLEIAAKHEGVSVDRLIDEINVYQCNECRSFYCDPWIDSETASAIFVEGAPDHIAGWANFEHWISDARPGQVEHVNRKLYTLLERRIGAVASYAEYACPFQGFLLLFKGDELSPTERIKSFANSMSRQHDVRWTRSVKLFHTAQRFSAKLTILYHSLRALRSSAGLNEPNQGALQTPNRRVLLTEGSSNRWGSNCVRYGGTCSYMAKQVLGAGVMPLAELIAKADLLDCHFDLIGIFNTLDHSHAPLKVLQDCLLLARHVVVATHHATVAGKQHLYAFHESFPEWLSGMLPEVLIEDLSLEMAAGQKRSVDYFLISRTR